MLYNLFQLLCVTPQTDLLNRQPFKQASKFQSKSQITGITNSRYDV